MSNEPGASDRLAAALEATLPKPKPKRDKQVMSVWSKAEYARVVAAAQARGVRPAAFVRSLVLAALDALEHER